ncbi:MAG: histidine triad nucleotide-binding protein [Candidatus Paceibacterota bacterium]
MEQCLFCKIINKEILSSIIYEDERFVAFKDINPKATIHVLIVPKKHIGSVDEIVESDKELMGEFMLIIQKVAEMLGVSGNYKVVINVGAGGGQQVNHLHAHLLSGENIQLP